MKKITIKDRNIYDSKEIAKIVSDMYVGRFRNYNGFLELLMRYKKREGVCYWCRLIRPPKDKPTIAPPA